MRFTVLGASGFIGRHLAAHLAREGHECLTPPREALERLKGPLGHAVYAVGVTADFRRRPFETVDAHVGMVRHLLENAIFESFLYLSSTRVYRRSRTAREDAAVSVDPADPEDLYDLSKLTGESLCLSHPSERVRVARLSNVYGADFESENFLATILRDAAVKGAVRLRTGPGSAKDYVDIADVVPLLCRIASGGRARVYNVASGVNVTHAELMESVRRLTGCRVAYAPAATDVVFPPVSIERARREFRFRPAPLPERLQDLIRCYKREPAPT